MSQTINKRGGLDGVVEMVTRQPSVQTEATSVLSLTLTALMIARVSCTGSSGGMTVLECQEAKINALRFRYTQLDIVLQLLFIRRLPKK